MLAKEAGCSGLATGAGIAFGGGIMLAGAAFAILFNAGIALAGGGCGSCLLAAGGAFKGTGAFGGGLLTNTPGTPGGGGLKSRGCGGCFGIGIQLPPCGATVAATEPAYDIGPSNDDCASESSRLTPKSAV